MYRTLTLSAVALCLALPVQAQNAQKPRELSQPIIRLTSVIKMNADELSLTAEQRADLKAWISTMPAKRKQLEADTLALRAKLRQAIIAGAPTAEREALAQEIGDQEARLITMRSNCTEHWRAALSAEQFSQAIALAGY